MNNNNELTALNAATNALNAALDAAANEALECEADYYGNTVDDTYYALGATLYEECDPESDYYDEAAAYDFVNSGEAFHALGA